MEGELKGSTAMERIYKETIEQKDTEIKTKNTKIQALEVRCAAVTMRFLLFGQNRSKIGLNSL